MEKKYTITFFSTSAVLLLLIFIFVTWTNPFRITNAPWSIDFVSDRNMAYKKFSLLQDNTQYTDLIVGSSTGEVFLADNIKKNFSIDVFQGTTGGSKTPFRFAEIKYAIETNPNLKHIIYVVDFFEFSNTDLESTVYFQKDIMENIDADLRSQLVRPDWISRLQDYFSESTFKAGTKTLKDYKKFKSGSYASEFKLNGSTRPILDDDHNQDLEGKTSRLAISHKHLYEGMTKLNPLTLEFFSRLLTLTKQHDVKITFVITPMRKKFYDYFGTYLPNSDKLYADWVQYMRGLASDSVKVVDYSFPLYLEKGISDTKDHWHDGIHFGVSSADMILKEVYKK